MMFIQFTIDFFSFSKYLHIIQWIYCLTLSGLFFLSSVGDNIVRTDYTNVETIIHLMINRFNILVTESLLRVNAFLRNVRLIVPCEEAIVLTNKKESTFYLRFELVNAQALIVICLCNASLVVRMQRFILPFYFQVFMHCFLCFIIIIKDFRSTKM